MSRRPGLFDGMPTIADTVEEAAAIELQILRTECLGGVS